MIIVLSFIISLISFFLFKCASGTMALNRINMISVIYYYYLMFISYIGVLLIFYGYAENPVILLVTNKTIFLGWMLVSYTMIALPFGILIVKFLLKIRDSQKLFNKYAFKKIVPLLSKKDSFIRIFLYILTFLSLFSCIYMITTVKDIPQLNLLYLSNYSDVLYIRNKINREFHGIYLIKSIFFEQLTPLLSYITYSYYRLTNSFRDKIWFFLMLFLSIFALTFSLAKGTLVVYIITFLILHIYINGYIKWKKFIMFLIVSLVFLLFMFLVMVKDSLLIVIQYLINRIFVDQISGAFLMFEIFPSKYKHIEFLSLSKPISLILFGQYSEPSTRIAMEYAFPKASELGYMNLLSTLFIGEAWANFGWTGVLLGPIYIGIIIGSFYYFILKSKKTPILLGLFAYFSFGVNIGSQFNQYIYNSTVFVLLFIFAISIFWAFMLKHINKRK